MWVTAKLFPRKTGGRKRSGKWAGGMRGPRPWLFCCGNFLSNSAHDAVKERWDLRAFPTQLRGLGSSRAAPGFASGLSHRVRGSASGLHAPDVMPRPVCKPSCGPCSASSLPGPSSWPQPKGRDSIRTRFQISCRGLCEFNFTDIVLLRRWSMPS